MPGQTRSTKKQYGLGRTDATELLLPSGNTCLVKRPGVQGLIKAGLLDSLDSLTSIVQVEHIDANDPKKMAAAVSKMAADPARINEALDVVDKAVCFAVVAPKVFMPPPDGETRMEDAVYADDVDEEDKMFIFQFLVGGTRDVESFRKESQAMLGGVPTIQDVPLPAE